MTGLLSKAFLCLALLLVQTAQTAVPVGNEPRHHVVFQNDYVRVIDAVVPAGDVTLFHTHSIDNVPVAISGGRMKTEVLGGKVTESDVKTGGVWFAPASYTHRISNIGQTTLRFIDAEILKSPRSNTATPSLRKYPGHRLELENEQVRIYRLNLGPGEETGRHTHALPGLRVEVTGGKVAIRSRGDSKSIINMKAGAFEWSGENQTHSLANAGESAYEAIEIEWK
jgi:quercetin dioxygenase-like cupin family protein